MYGHFKDSNRMVVTSLAVGGKRTINQSPRNSKMYYA